MSEISPSDLDPPKQAAIFIDGASRKQQISGKHGVGCRFAGGFGEGFFCRDKGFWKECERKETLLNPRKIGKEVCE